ncbi:MAG: S-formylglutathione hydrolase [Caulobacter sp.]|nr:S-formylglutathione hydrolase [Caulobacter sp.]
MPSTVEILSSHRTFNGTLHYCRHASKATGTPMRFTLFLPDGEGPFPLLLWLSGLTCTEENFTTKGGAYGPASDLGLAILAPDTSPRGDEVADDEAFDFGKGAGFYVDATRKPWAPHFTMETYIVRDLLEAASATFPLDSTRRGISGHSMGGHGALTLALRHPNLFKSVSAFAPISSPTRCPWGRKAFAGYLGDDEKTWREHDAALLIEAGVAKGKFDEILVEQGTADPWLVEQLKPELLEAAAKASGQRLTVRRQDGYDHGYFFVQSFIADHLAWHAAKLRR